MSHPHFLRANSKPSCDHHQSRHERTGTISSTNASESSRHGYFLESLAYLDTLQRRTLVAEPTYSERTKRMTYWMISLSCSAPKSRFRVSTHEQDRTRFLCRTFSMATRFQSFPSGRVGRPYRSKQWGIQTETFRESAVLVLGYEPDIFPFPVSAFRLTTRLHVPGCDSNRACGSGRGILGSIMHEHDYCCDDLPSSLVASVSRPESRDPSRKRTGI